MKQKTVDISGFGRPGDKAWGYEEACQKMLWTGIRYLSKLDVPLDIFKGTHDTKLKASKDTKLFGAVDVKAGDTIELIGILNTPDSCRELEKEMSDAVNSDVTGAMHQYVMGHLRYIAEHGVTGWLDSFKDDKDRTYEIDVDEMLGVKS